MLLTNQSSSYAQTTLNQAIFRKLLVVDMHHEYFYLNEDRGHIFTVTGVISIFTVDVQGRIISGHMKWDLHR